MTINKEIERQARALAVENRKAEPAISSVYWFPNDDEVRLVELSREIPASNDGELHPFYFRASKVDNLPAPSAIAIIRPEEFERLGLPEDWGQWSDAVEL